MLPFVKKVVKKGDKISEAEAYKELCKVTGCDVPYKVFDHMVEVGKKNISH